MTTVVPSTALATIQPAFTDAERLALAGFLAGYRSLTMEAYALELRQFTTWCRTRSLAWLPGEGGALEKAERSFCRRPCMRVPIGVPADHGSTRRLTLAHMPMRAGRLRTYLCNGRHARSHLSLRFAISLVSQLHEEQRSQTPVG